MKNRGGPFVVHRTSCAWCSSSSSSYSAPVAHKRFPSGFCLFCALRLLALCSLKLYLNSQSETINQLCYDVPVCVSLTANFRNDSRYSLIHILDSYRSGRWSIGLEIVRPQRCIGDFPIVFPHSHRYILVWPWPRSGRNIKTKNSNTRICGNMLDSILYHAIVGFVNQFLLPPSPSPKKKNHSKANEAIDKRYQSSSKDR